MLPATIPYEFIRDSQMFPVGRHELKALHIPGHTLGLVAFQLDDRYLFTGDSIFIQSIARSDLGGKAETWAPLHGRSLRRLLDLRCQRVRSLCEADSVRRKRYGRHCRSKTRRRPVPDAGARGKALGLREAACAC
ncbi:MAG: hypothetical protein ABSH28_02385 [Acidobacteriota bacterium]